MNIDLTKTTVNGASTTSVALTEADNLITITIPLPADLQDKYSYTVYRYHESAPGAGYEVQTITQNQNACGEYLEISDDKTELTLHVRLFSVYAVAYEDEPLSTGAASYAVKIDGSFANGTVTASKVRVYDKNGKLVASTKLSQCKYGSRQYDTTRKIK